MVTVELSPTGAGPGSVLLVEKKSVSLADADSAAVAINIAKRTRVVNDLIAAPVSYECSCSPAASDFRAAVKNRLLQRPVSFRCATRAMYGRLPQRIMEC